MQLEIRHNSKEGITPGRRAPSRRRGAPFSGAIHTLRGPVLPLHVAGAVSGSSGEGSSSGVDREAEGLRRNWWAAAREVMRVTKGKGLVVSGGAENVGDIRAPRDAENLCVGLVFLELCPQINASASGYACSDLHKI